MEIGAVDGFHGPRRKRRPRFRHAHRWIERFAIGAGGHPAFDLQPGEVEFDRFHAAGHLQPLHEPDGVRRQHDAENPGVQRKRGAIDDSVAERCQRNDLGLRHHSRHQRQLVNAQFKYYYDINGNGLDDDGGTWVNIGDPTVPIGTTVTANWNIQNLIQGTYLIALEITDNRGHTTQTHDPIVALDGGRDGL